MVATLLATVVISDLSQPQTSSNNRLAYRPRYNDNQNSNPAGGSAFTNLKKIFSECLVALNYNFCHVLTEVEDGLCRNDGAVVIASDSGNESWVFSSSSNDVTFDIAIQQWRPKYNATCVATHAPGFHCCLLSSKISLTTGQFRINSIIKSSEYAKDYGFLKTVRKHYKLSEIKAILYEKCMTENTKSVLKVGENIWLWSETGLVSSWFNFCINSVVDLSFRKFNIMQSNHNRWNITGKESNSLVQCMHTAIIGYT